MIFVDSSEADERLEHPNNIVHKLMHDSGRKKGDKNLTPEKRAEIGTLAIIEGPSVAADTFGVSVSQASNYAHGKNGYEQKSEELEKKVNENVEIIHNVALQKLLSTLSAIDEDQILTEKPRIQAGIAKDLATVIEKTSPKSGPQIGQQVIIYSPKIDSAEKYDTIVLPEVIK